MAIVTPDFSEAVESTSEPIPSGIYQARVTAAENRTSEKGNSYISWKLQLFGAEGEYAKYNNWPVYYNTMLSGKGAGMLKTFYKSTTGEVLEGAFDTDSLLGREVEVTVAQRLQADGTVSKWPDVKNIRPLT